MMPPNQLGIALPTRTGLPTGQLAEFAAAAESSGFTACFVSERYDDALAVLAAVIGATSQVEVGTAIANISFRHPALMAMAGARLDELSGGRMRLGLGSGDPDANAHQLGVEVGSPLQRMSEYVEVVRRLATPAPVDYEGALFRLRDLVLDRPSSRPIPIYVAALRQRMMSLATQIADGVVLNLVHRPTLGQLIERLRQTRAAGPGPQDFRVVCLVPVCVTDDEAAGVERGRSVIVNYAVHPAVSRVFAAHGHQAELCVIQALMRRGERAAAVAHVPDSMVRDYVIIGGAEQCRRRVAAYVEAGVDLPVLFPVAHPFGWAAAVVELLSVARRCNPVEV